jgi:hypothetical protein
MEWYRKLCMEGLHDQYCSPNIIRVFKLGLMRQTGNVAWIRDSRNAYFFLKENLKEGNHLEYTGLRSRWKGDIKETRWVLLHMVMNIQLVDRLRLSTGILLCGKEPLCFDNANSLQNGSQLSPHTRVFICYKVVMAVTINIVVCWNVSL